MSARDSLYQVGAFVLIVAVVLGGTAIAGTMSTTPTHDVPAVENEQFQPQSILPSETSETGSIEMSSDAEGKTILVDAGHENRISDSKLHPLVSTLVENGHEVVFFDRQDRELNASLRKADAFVVMNPRQRYSDEQVAGIEKFEDAGGRVLLMSDPAQTRIGGSFFMVSVEQVGAKDTALSSPFGVAFNPGYVYNMQENANNFKSVYAEASGNGDLADGVDRVVFREAAPVATGNGGVVLTGLDGTTLSTTRKTGSYAVAVRNGDVAAVGDTDFLAPENAYVADNDVFIGNLADFLVSGDKEPGAPSTPGPERPARPGGAPGEPPSGDAPRPAPTPTPAP